MLRAADVDYCQLSSIRLPKWTPISPSSPSHEHLIPRKDSRTSPLAYLQGQSIVVPGGSRKILVEVLIFQQSSPILGLKIFAMQSLCWPPTKQATRSVENEIRGVRLTSTFQMFFSSQSNSIKDHAALLERLQCDIFLASMPHTEITAAILSERPMQTLELPGLDFWLRESKVPIYKYEKTFEEARLDPFAVMHSSGTTGTPKVIVLKHGSCSPLDSYQLIPLLRGEHFEPFQVCRWKGKRVFTSFPYFHAAGLLFLLPMAIYTDFIPVIVPSTSRVSAEIANSVHIHGNVDASCLPPSVLVDISRNPIFLEQLRGLRYVSFVGGPLPTDIGEEIAKRTNLTSLFGSTETGFLPTEASDLVDWPFLRFSPCLNAEFRPFGDGMYELYIKRDTTLEAFQGIFATFPELQEYSMKDLFVKHPTKEAWWRSCGRTDEVIVFTDARKLNPTLMEAVIESQPSVRSALLCGHARPRPALVVEPVSYPTTEEEEAKLMCEVWAAAERAMQQGPVSGKLDRDLVLLTVPEKPLMRAGGKGTIQRKRSLAMYEDEVDRLYIEFARKTLEASNSLSA